MIAALPTTGLELTIQMTAPPLSRLDGSDVAVRILAGPAGSVPLPADQGDLAASSTEWRLVMQEFLARIAAILGAPASTADLPRPGLPRGLADGAARPSLVRTVSRPSNTAGPWSDRDSLSRVTVGDLEIDIPAHRVTQQGRPVTLTRQEFALLLVLLNRAGQVVRREELQHDLWNHSTPVNSRALDQCVFKLRRKLEADPSEPRYLHCIRGVGYRLDVEPGPGT